MLFSGAVFGARILARGLLVRICSSNVLYGIKISIYIYIYVPAHLATMDHLCRHQAPYALILRQQEFPSYALVAPTTDGEQRLLLAKFRHSRPGPSGWKVCYLGAFPDEVQQLYWRCLNTLRLLGTVPPSLLCSQQVHLAKPAGGWRPLSMLEENIKAVEAPVAARLAPVNQKLCLG